jgi:multidrug efflux pump subunit AcrA (membrane-fusion protein)
MKARQLLIVVGFSAAATLALAACSGESTSDGASPTTPVPTETGSPSPTEGPSEPAPSPTDAVEIEVEVEDGQVDGPGRVTVAQGATIDLEVKSDRADEVHVHGYDLSEDVGPGRPARIVFDATLPGIFEIELEDAGLLLLQLEVTP